MAKFNCFSGLVGRKKKGDEEQTKTTKDNNKTLHVRLEHPVKPFDTDELKVTSFTVAVPSVVEDNAECNVKVVASHDPSPVPKSEPTDVAYEGEDEHEECFSMKRNNSDFDLQSHEEISSLGKKMMSNPDSFETDLNEALGTKSGEIDLMQSGHMSDPGIRKSEVWASPVLKRSCSNLETRDVLRRIANQLPPSKSQSFEELQGLAETMMEEINPGSPASVATHFSADKVMLKKHSSSQILPSRSRRLWWKLFLWSHRNMHKQFKMKPVALPALAALNQQGGYSSDTLEPSRSKFRVTESPASESANQFPFDGKLENENRDGFRLGSGLWPHNQWVAFPAESSSSPLSRVDEWVKDLSIDPESPYEDDNGENSDDGAIAFPPSPETARSPSRGNAPHHLIQHKDANLPEEILQANAAVRSLNSSSTVAHICGIGLKVMPTISRFSSLKSVNLSSNSIVRITAGSLPKGLHVLSLARNNISVIEGLRELTRLRVLDLSYNRISRIGHGLSYCTLIKELYLRGNKISEVEGLHRLLKLTVLDLSFNKIATTKALGQLVANYNSLQALNLLGNPIQRNINDDQLRKSVCGLLSKLVYLNKQTIKQQRAREVLMDSVAKAALGSGSRTSRRKAVRRVGGQSGSTSLPSSVHKRSENIKLKIKNKSRSQTHHRLP